MGISRNLEYIDIDWLILIFNILETYTLLTSIVTCSDTFDENTPPVDEPEYISSLGAAIFEGMQSGDDKAVWLMQVNI